ncbi:hypothetical protein ATANTOWER_000426 [Ataeniobius toweri]|uniref:Uncharacterized protein n=1 Tax=Ataeniobius toweri TaxID=208326 RepID=A0ABU7A0N6_9TELE|nr:hypothetical protein [Ataeniobius toweri]
MYCLTIAFSSGCRVSFSICSGLNEDRVSEPLQERALSTVRDSYHSQLFKLLQCVKQCCSFKSRTTRLLHKCLLQAVEMMNCYLDYSLLIFLVFFKLWVFKYF